MAARAVGMNGAGAGRADAPRRVPVPRLRPRLRALTAGGTYAHNTPPPRRARADHPAGAPSYIYRTFVSRFFRRMRNRRFPYSSPYAILFDIMSVELYGFRHSRKQRSHQ